MTWPKTRPGQKLRQASQLQDNVLLAQAHAAQLVEALVGLRQQADEAAAAAVTAASLAAEAQAAAEAALFNSEEANKEASAAIKAVEDGEVAVLDANKAAEHARVVSMLPFSPTGNAPSGPTKMWDVQVAVHCVKPTGKKAASTMYDVDEMLAETRSLLEAQDKAIADARQQCADAKAELSRAVEGDKQAETTLMAEQEQQKTLLKQERVLMSGRWKPPTLPHGAEAAHAAWVDTLPVIRKRLDRLHEEGFVEYAVLGFVRSDADSWRRFWTRRELAVGSGSTVAGNSSPRLQRPGSSSGGDSGGIGGGMGGTSAGAESPRLLGLDVVRCVAPRPCVCALCAHRSGAEHLMSLDDASDEP